MVRTSPRRLLVAAVLLAGCKEPTAPRIVASLTIVPAAATILENHGAPFHAIVLDSAGAVIEGVEVTWSSSDPAILGARRSDSGSDGSERGYVNGVKPGTAMVSARVGDKLATATVTVLRGAAARVDVGPLIVSLLAGQTQQLTAIVKDADGYTLNGRTVTWTSSNALATVSATGLVTAVSAGQAFITAQSEGASTTREITVVPAVVSYEYYKRGGPATPGEATLTFGNAVTTGTLRIDGLTLPALISHSAAGQYCILSSLINGQPGLITACGSRPSPTTLWLCTSPNGLDQPRVMQYVLFPANAPDRVPSSADPLLAAMLGTSTTNGLDVIDTCHVNTQAPRWARAGTSADFWLFPNTATTYTQAQVRAMLTGALIYSTPGAGTDFKQYVVLRMGAGLFEIWH